jgi:NTE family protein
MSVTLIQKSNLRTKIEKPKLGLVLAGGSLTGAAYKIGGLKALNDYLINRKLTDFDIYLGISAGSVLAVPLAGGIPPEEMLASIDGKSLHFSQLSPYELYRPNWMEYLSRPLKYFYGQLSYLPSIMWDIAKASPGLKDDFFSNCKKLITNPTYSNYEELTKPFLKIAYSDRHIPSFGEMLPSGIFNNEPIEKYLKHNLKRNKMPNNFRVLKRMRGKSLYMVAMDLDTSGRVIFGPDEKNDVNISEAAQASSCIPGFYKPTRLKGVDYIDGGVRRTGNISVAFDKGADLVICYNPFRPFNNELFLEYLREQNKYTTKNKRLSELGVGTVVNQVFRTLFHSRMQYGLQMLANDPKFKKDIIVIEPEEDNRDFFNVNPLFFWNRPKAVQLGFDAVKSSIESEYPAIKKILAKYGIQMSKEIIQQDETRIKQSKYDEHVIMEVLEEHHDKPQSSRRKLKVIRGGRKA